jgi:hypothetical protein
MMSLVGLGTTESATDIDYTGKPVHANSETGNSPFHFRDAKKKKNQIGHRNAASNLLLCS